MAKKTTDDERLSENVRELLRSESNHPLSTREITSALNIPRNRIKTLKRILRDLVRSGDIFKTRRGCYGPVDKMNLLTGTFEAHRDGYGFLIPESPGEKDVFVPPGRTLAAMSGDRVVVRIENATRREGSVVRIVERGRKRVVAEFHRQNNMFYVVPRNRKIPFGIIISPRNRGEARDGDLVVAEITTYPTLTRPPEGRVLKILDQVTEALQETNIILEEYGLPKRFPVPVLREVKQMPVRISARNRVDCREMPTVTIDGETAKDFDDAVTLYKTNSSYILYVHIADVSHYVPWNSIVDIEAAKRGTSVYFPGSVIPMLPERLSNDLCSLRPNIDRLTFTVEMHISKKGQITEKRFYPSIIRSDERMTYTSVKKILLDRDEEETMRYAAMAGMFRDMEELCQILREERMRRGSLDFDLPEPEVILNLQGQPEAICRAERNIAHMIIEEFMIAANEAVASFLEEKDVPSLYRVHEEPDTSKLEELKPIFRTFGIEIKRTGTAAFHQILKKIKGSDVEHILNIILLRSLKQARYSPENLGHFGLASDCYTHFTSPIRRYPDLVVHRILKEIVTAGKLSIKKREFLESVLGDISVQSSKRERLADDAEREIVNAMRAWFMKDHVGDEFTGSVSSISAKGMRVLLRDFFVEGFLHVSAMEDDYYRFDEKGYSLVGRHSKKSFRLGQEISVRIERVDIKDREIHLALA
jgi:ribonuclease R